MLVSIEMIRIMALKEVYLLAMLFDCSPEKGIVTADRVVIEWRL